MGYQSGYSVTTGGSNIFMGYQSGYYTQTGASNVVIGEGAGKGATGNSYSNNAFIGYRAGYKNTTGLNNIFMGYAAGFDNTSGANNVFIGSSAGGDNTLGGSNTFIGHQAGLYTLTGNYNTAIGFEAGAGAAFQSYSSNTFIGYRSGYSMTTGTDNVFLGYQSGYNETGSNKLYIENSDSSSPLIYGEFDNNFLRVNGDLDVTGNLTVSGTVPASAHKASHQSGGGDAIQLDNLAAPDDNTDLDATTGVHGLLPKLGGGTDNFLRADGSWAEPGGGGFPDWTAGSYAPFGNQGPRSEGYTAVFGSFVKVGEFLCPQAGTITSRVGAKREPATDNSYVKVYVNGDPVGAQRSTVSQTWVYWTENISVSADDLVQVYCHRGSNVGNAFGSIEMRVGNPILPAVIPSSD
jgi:hypothetical protein